MRNSVSAIQNNTVISSCLIAIFCLLLSFGSALSQSSDSRTQEDKEEPAIGYNINKQSRLEIIKWLNQVNTEIANGGDSKAIANQFFKKLATLKLTAPMVELNAIKTQLKSQNLAQQTLGKQFSDGGTPVEQALLSYRRDATYEAIRNAVGDVSSRYGGRSVENSVYLAKIGKWTTQGTEMMTFAGDIDFSFLGADPLIIKELTSGFKKHIERITGLSMVALDSVATAHGFAEHMVYIGPQGKKYGDDAIMQLGQNGIERIDFRDPDAVGKNKSDLRINGETALWSVVVEETIRKKEGKVSDFSDFEKAWNERRGQSVEPFLSMEMVRHLQGDVIKNLDVFKAIDIAKKGSKFLRRSNQQMGSDLDVRSSDAPLANFTTRLDDMATKSSASEMAKFIATESKKIGMPFFDMIVRNGQAELEISRTNAEKFMTRIKQSIWSNVSNGLAAHVRTLLRAKNSGATKGGNGPQADQLKKTLEMLAKGIEVMNQQKVSIPPDVLIKSRVLSKLIESFSATNAYALPPAQLKKIKEMLDQASKAPHLAGRLLALGTVISHVDHYMTQNYDAISAKLPGHLVTNRASAMLDTLNSAFDGIDDVLITDLRNSGIIKFVDGSGDNATTYTIVEFPKIGAINQRLNNSIFARIGNNTAFKAVNLYSEGEAYFQALAKADSVLEGFQNLATEIFRRRTPVGGLVEAYMMENHLRMGVEVIYALFPIAAIPEGVYGMAKSAALSAKTVYWNTEFELLVDKMYADAKFKQIDRENQEISFQLQSIEHNGHRFTRENLFSTSSKFISETDVNDILGEKLRNTDPLLTMYGTLKNHKAVGEKLTGRYEKLEKAQWRKIKTQFVAKMIERLEKRKAAERLIDMGRVDELFAELMAITTKLKIQVSVERVMDEKFDSGLLKLLWQHLINRSRTELRQPLTQTEYNRFVGIMIDQIDGYKVVLDARQQTEAGVNSWFAGTSLNAPSEKTQYGQRVLTGVSALSGIVDRDLRVARYWRSRPTNVLRSIRLELANIKSLALGETKQLEGNFDRQMLVRVSYKQFWIEVFKRAKVPVVSVKSKRDRLEVLQNQRKALIDEFKAHYSFVEDDQNTTGLTVRIIPDRTLSLDPKGTQILQSGNYVTLTAVVLKSNSTGEIRYNWAENGRVIGDSNSIVVDNTILDSGLHKISVFVMDAKQKEATAFFEINIRDLSKYERQFEDHRQMVTERQPLKLRLKKLPEDTAEYRYTWKRDNRVVQDKVSFNYFDISDFQGHAGSSINFSVDVYDGTGLQAGMARTVITVIEPAPVADADQGDGREAVEENETTKVEAEQEKENVEPARQADNDQGDGQESVEETKKDEEPKEAGEEKTTDVAATQGGAGTEKEWIARIEQAHAKKDWQRLIELQTEISGEYKNNSSKGDTNTHMQKPVSLLKEHLRAYAEEKGNWFKKDVWRYLGRLNSASDGAYGTLEGRVHQLILERKGSQEDVDKCLQEAKQKYKILQSLIRDAKKEHPIVVKKMFDNQGSNIKQLTFIMDFINKYGIPENLEISVNYSSPCVDDSEVVIAGNLEITISGEKSYRITPRQTVTLKADTRGGKAPVTIQWIGNVSPSGSTAIFTATNSGSYVVQATAEDSDGQIASASVTITVDGDLPMPSLSGLSSEIFYGTSKTISVSAATSKTSGETAPASLSPFCEKLCNDSLKTDDGLAGVIMVSPTEEDPCDCSPSAPQEEYEYIWISNKSGGIEFDPPSSRSPNVIVTFGDMGDVEIWAQVMKDGMLVGETEAINTKVIPPKFTLAIEPKTPLVGEEVKATISLTPDIENRFLRFRWLPMGSFAQELGQSNGGRTYAFKPKEAKSATSKPTNIEVLVMAQPYAEQEIAHLNLEVPVLPYDVNVKFIGSIGPKPLIWKQGQGLVEDPRQIAVFQNVRMAAEIKPNPESGSLRYSWALNEDTHFSGGDTGREVTVNRSQTGSGVAIVTISDKDGNILGKGSGSFNATISQQVIDDGKQKAEEQEQAAKQKKDQDLKVSKTETQKKADLLRKILKQRRVAASAKVDAQREAEIQRNTEEQKNTTAIAKAEADARTKAQTLRKIMEQRRATASAKAEARSKADTLRKILKKRRLAALEQAEDKKKTQAVPATDTGPEPASPPPKKPAEAVISTVPDNEPANNKTGGYWKFVEVTGSVGRECTPDELYNSYYHNLVSGQEGVIEITHLIRKSGHKFYSARGTWQRPPQKMYPDSTIEIPVTIEKLFEDTSDYKRSLSIYFDTHDSKCGSSGAGTKIGGLKNDPKSPTFLEKSIQWNVKAPNDEKQVEELVIRACYSNVQEVCGERGWKYHYEWTVGSP